MAASFLKFLACLLLINLAVSAEDGFIFNGFEGSTKNLRLNGLAAVTPNGLLELTNATKQIFGHAFYSIPITFRRRPTGNIFSFSTTYVFAIRSEYPTLSGHGIAFVISQSKELPGATASQYLGLFNILNNGNATNHVFAVELDTIQSSEFKDIDDNHVGIDINGLRSNKSHTAGYYTNDAASDGGYRNLSLISGDPMQVWVEYDGNSMQLNVTISPIDVAKPNRPLISTALNLSDVILDTMYVGFSSATGSVLSSHYIQGWSFQMNGKAQALDLSRLPPLPRRKTAKEKYKSLAISIPLATAVFLSLIVAVVVFIVKRRIKYAELLEDWELEYGPRRFSFKDLYIAAKGFKEKELLGTGGFGQVYHGVLSTSKLEVAIKRVSHDSRQGIKEFVAEVVSIGQLRHRNLVQLLGYCRRKGELLLVYDFMPNGSLDKFLFEESKSTLSWNQRFQIIKGVASGLLYLHEDWEKVVIHRDIKASNVLLDGEMNGRLGDFGLARLYDHGTDPHTTHVVGTMGYLAPELARTGRASTATDVFAFGAFLLEVACGRRPIDPQTHGEDLILVDWVSENWRRGNLLETRDPKLGSNYIVEEMELVLKLGLMCSHPMPKSRPSMRQVVQILDGSIPLPELSATSLDSSILEMLKNEGFDDYIMSFPSSMSTGSVLSGGR